MNLKQAVSLNASFRATENRETPQKDNAAFVGKPYVLIDGPMGYGHEISEHDNYQDAFNAMMARPNSRIIRRPNLQQTQQNRNSQIAWSQLQNPDVQAEADVVFEIDAGGPGSGCNPQITRCGRRGKGWIGVDFDGTLAKFPRHWVGPTELGEPIPEMVAKVKKWLAKGKDVRLFTARAANKNPREMYALRKWMQTHIGQTLPITATKDIWLKKVYDDSARHVSRDRGKILADSAAPVSPGSSNFKRNDAVDTPMVRDLVRQRRVRTNPDVDSRADKRSRNGVKASD